MFENVLNILKYALVFLKSPNMYLKCQNRKIPMQNKNVYPAFNWINKKKKNAIT